MLPSSLHACLCAPCLQASTWPRQDARSEKQSAQGLVPFSARSRRKIVAIVSDCFLLLFPVLFLCKKENNAHSHFTVWANACNTVSRFCGPTQRAHPHPLPSLSPLTIDPDHPGFFKSPGDLGEICFASRPQPLVDNAASPMMTLLELWKLARSCEFSAAEHLRAPRVEKKQ